MWCYADSQQFSVGDVFNVALHGLTLDLSTALYFLIVPFLLALANIWVDIPRWVLRCYNTFAAIVFALAFVADTSLYEFWRFKLDTSCLQYLETPGEIVANVSVGYLLLRFFITIGAAVGIYYCLSKSQLPTRSKASSNSKALSDTETQGTTRKDNLKAWLLPRIGETVFYLLLIPLMVIGIRGGIGDATTNTGQAYYSQNQFLNHSAVNPIFNFLYSVSHQMEDFSVYEYFSEAERAQLVGDVYPTTSIETDTLLTTDRPNVVIILMEGAGEQFASIMPYLQQLKQEGISFSQCFGNSWRTDRGTVSVLSGYPTFPTVSVMKMPEKSRLIPSIALRLNGLGYQTSYLYGGDANFTNMRSYILATGWQQLTDVTGFTRKEQQTGAWGVRDDITFKRLFDQMTQDAQSKPDGHFLYGYSTLSSHEPWEVPTQKLDDKVHNTFAYLDDCIKNFVEGLKGTPLWKNLLIILTADHGINYGQIDNSTPLQKNHIPMIWVGGAVKAPRTIDAFCNQSDLAATLLGQLQLPHDEFVFSRDVLSKSYVHPTAVNNYNNAQWVIDSTGHMLYDFDSQSFVVSEGANRDGLLRLSKAILQTTANDLTNRQ